MLRSLLCVAACLGASGLQAGAALRGAGVQRAAAPQMVGVPLANFDGEKVGTKPVELKVAKSGAYIVQRKVVAEQANMRLGTAKTKTRTEVRGGGRKPYKQKGTGRARQGSIRTPLRRGGGVLFGPRGVGKARYSIRMNKKEKQLAISTALMGSTSKMTVVEDFEEKARRPHCPLTRRAALPPLTAAAAASHCRLTANLSSSHTSRACCPLPTAASLSHHPLAAHYRSLRPHHPRPSPHSRHRPYRLPIPASGQTFYHPCWFRREIATSRSRGLLGGCAWVERSLSSTRPSG